MSAVITATRLPVPFYDEGGIVLYHGDCREILPLLELRVDIVLTDPPYSEETHKGARTARNYAFTTGGTDAPLITFAPLSFEGIRCAMNECGKAARGWVIAFMDFRHVAQLEVCPPDNLRFVRFGIWNKPNGAPQFTGDRPAQGFEAIAIMHREEVKLAWNGGGTRAVWTFAKEQNNEHPTQKPIPLINKLLELFSNPGDTVLDPFCGSGTTLVAAKQLGRRAIGIEIDEAYCRIAVQRLAQGCLELA